jgi:hypothetical protein
MNPSKRTRRALLSLALLLSVPSFEAAAQDSAGGKAVIADTSDGGGPGGGTFFILLSVNGTDVPETALSESSRASFGRGAYMVVKGAERQVPAGKVTLKLRAVQTHVAPIDSIFRAIFRGGNPEASGTVTVELSAGQRYKVNGVLDTLRREVWIEDDRGAILPGSTVTGPVDADLLRQMEGAPFVTNNLRYDGDWISEAPNPELLFVPIGSRLKVLDYGSNRASVLIDGRKMRMGIDWTRGKETIQQYVARVTSTADPRLQLATFPEKVRNAIRSGRVFAGMTKEQVLMALGKPRLDFTPTLSEREWKYEVYGQGDLYVVFDEAGVLKEVDGSRQARKLVVFETP